MTGDRTYPDEPAGPFQAPPREFVDSENRTIEIRSIANCDPSIKSALVDMYDAFDPADRAQGIPPVTREDIVAWIDVILEQGIDVVAFHSQVPVGHATLVPDGHGAFELAIFVDRAFRGVGIGSALVQSLLGAAGVKGIEFVWLTVERWNTVAIRLYESVGFERTAGGNFELEMSIRLAPHTDSTGCDA